MPSKGTTPRAIRIPDDLWDAALAIARERSETLSQAIRRFLEEYVKPQPPTR
ncbi:hypothetical protein [Sinomonas sp.]|uniref:hypothetical protein n=1 Tax=Sinomonas sp. TaxID=1914986 RepID=UPI003F7FBDB4